MLYRMTTKVCKVHFVRDILGHVRKNDGKRVLALLRGIAESPTLELAQRNLAKAVKALALVTNEEREDRQYTNIRTAVDAGDRVSSGLAAA